MDTENSINISFDLDAQRVISVNHWTDRFYKIICERNGSCPKGSVKIQDKQFKKK